jgi:hypothetical protein
MSEVPICEECGVPSYITGEHTWLSDGAIVQARNRRTRMAFLESENWDALWAGVSGLIGAPIERIVIETARQGARVYIGKLIPDQVKELVQKRESDPHMLIDGVLGVALLMGYGKTTELESRFEFDEDDQITILYEEPYSVPLAVGSVVGTTEAITQQEGGYEFKQVSPYGYEVTYYRSRQPEELKARIRRPPYEPSEGRVQLESCSTCGGPAALSDYRWSLSRGVIKNSVTGRRMAVIGPGLIDPVFEELERELGEDIPRTVVEAQRRFVRSGPYLASEITGEDEMRRQLTLRGLGELRELSMGRKGVRMTVGNAAMHLWVVGLVQGLYELAFGEGSEVEWELSDDGLLQVTVTRSDGGAS